MLSFLDPRRLQCGQGKLNSVSFIKFGVTLTHPLGYKNRAIGDKKNKMELVMSATENTLVWSELIETISCPR